MRDARPGKSNRPKRRVDPSLRAAQRSFAGQQLAAALSMAHPHRHTAIANLQSVLGSAGLGGLAHPIRRLHNPGGSAEFPLGGRAPIRGEIPHLMRGFSTKAATAGIYPGSAEQLLNVWESLIDSGHLPAPQELPFRPHDLPYDRARLFQALMLRKPASLKNFRYHKN
jgi:hypothetical protein